VFLCKLIGEDVSGAMNPHTRETLRPDIRGLGQIKRNCSATETTGRDLSTFFFSSPRVDLEDEEGQPEHPRLKAHHGLAAKFLGSRDAWSYTLYCVAAFAVGAILWGRTKISDRLCPSTRPLA